MSDNPMDSLPAEDGGDLDWHIGTIYRSRNAYKDEAEFRQKIELLLTEARKGYVPEGKSKPYLTTEELDAMQAKVPDLDLTKPWDIITAYGRACDTKLAFGLDRSDCTSLILHWGRHDSAKLYTQSELNQAVEEAEIRGRIIEVKRLLTVYSHKPSLFDLVHNETDSAMLANERLIKDLTEREQELKLKVSLRGSAAQPPLNTKDKA